MGYKEDCINSTITELPGLISWCKTGIFNPTVVRIGMQIASQKYGYDQFFQTQSGDQYSNIGGGDEWFDVEDLEFGELRSAPLVKSVINSPLVQAERQFVTVAAIQSDISSAMVNSQLFVSAPAITHDITSDADLIQTILERLDNDYQGSDVYRGVFADENYLYIGANSDGVKSHSVNPSTGVITHLSSAKLTNSNTYSICTIPDAINGDILFAVGSNSAGTYRIAANGDLTPLQHYQDGVLWWDCFAHGEFVFAAGGLGLRVYTVNGVTGALTIKATDIQGTADYRGIFVDDNLAYVSCAAEGIRTYTVAPGTGALTYKDRSDQSDSFYQGIWGKDGFIWATNSSLGVRNYSVDPATGLITYIGRTSTAFAVNRIWGDDNLVYTAGGGLRAFTVNPNGTLVEVDYDFVSNTYYDVYADNDFIYVARWNSGVDSYRTI